MLKLFIAVPVYLIVIIITGAVTALVLKIIIEIRHYIYGKGGKAW